jgi:hypothetical protein
MKVLLAATAVVAVLAVPALAQDTKFDQSRGDTIQDKPSTPVAPGVTVIRPRTAVSGDEKGERGSEGAGGTTGAGTGGGTGGGGGGGTGGGGGGGGGGNK